MKFDRFTKFFLLIAVYALCMLTACESNSTTPEPGMAGIPSFIDTDAAEDIITGELTIQPAADEKNITEYRLYWGSNSDNKLSGDPIGVFNADGNSHSHNFSATAVPSGATHFLVYSASSKSESSACVSLDIPDLVCGMLFDINIDAESSSPQEFTEFKGKIYFSANDGTNGRELWVYDGTGNPVMIEINTTTDSGSNPSNLTVYNNKLCFSADNGENGQELWVYDGETTPVMYEINERLNSTTGVNLGAYPDHFTEFNGKLLFNASNGYSAGMWSYDGINAPERINLGVSSISPRFITPFQDILYFGGQIFDQPCLVSYDPALPVDTRDDTNPNPNQAFRFASAPLYTEDLHVFKDKLYFTPGSGSVADMELWAFDGSTAAVACDFRPDGHSYAKIEIIHNDVMYLTANDGTSTSIWKYDGENSPVKVALDPSFKAAGFVAYMDKIFFSCEEGKDISNLWVYDGINSPERVIKTNLNTTGDTDSNVRSLAVINGKLYFSASDGTHGIEAHAYCIK